MFTDSLEFQPNIQIDNNFHPNNLSSSNQASNQ